MTHIIIIGAGMSGIAAGRTLQDHGYTVTILEARDRIGGRTHTDASLGADIDLGAAWIHGPHGNPLTPLAKKFGVTTGYTDFENQFGNSVLAFDADGRQLDTAAYTRGANAHEGALYHLDGSILQDYPPKSCRSLADLLAFGLPNIDLSAMSPDEQKGFYYASVVSPQYEEASDLDLIDWQIGDDYVYLPGGDLLVYGGGYKTIIAGLAEGLNIQTNTAVSKISYKDDAITLTTTAGTVTADHVIITAPLGVLQAETITFDPPLPTKKQTAIGRMGMGNYEKIALKFPHIFWPLEPHRFNYLSNSDPELFNAWLNIAHYTNQPILVAYHAGSRAQHINQWSDEQLIDGCMQTLRTMFGPDIPTPTSHIRTGWEADPYSRGSYTYSKVGSKPKDRATLAKPINGRLFFAGEATHPHYFGTVHGAYETGIRAAWEIMDK